MNKLILTLATLSIIILSCNKMQKTAGGLEYKIFTSNGGEKIAAGDNVFFKVVGKAGDSVLYNTYKNLQTPYMAMTIKDNIDLGNFEEGLTLLGPGDSALFRINADSFYKVNVGAPTPSFIKKGEPLNFYVKIDSVITKKVIAERKTQLDLELMEKQKNESVLLEEYLKNSTVKYTKTNSGMYYTITKSTHGPIANKGDKISVNYTGKLLDGKEFDSNAKTGKPFEFELGAQQVIMGWDEIFGILHEGETATIIVPSSMAYGAQQMGPDIKPYSTLMFDVELLKITKAKK